MWWRHPLGRVHIVGHIGILQSKMYYEHDRDKENWVDAHNMEGKVQLQVASVPVAFAQVAFGEAAQGSFLTADWALLHSSAWSRWVVRVEAL